MPFDQVFGPVSCRGCKRVIEAGMTAYVGERTPFRWCEPCAEVLLGRSVDGEAELIEATAMGGLDKRALATAFPAFTAAMRAFKQRAAMKIQRGDVSARILGERE